MFTPSNAVTLAPVDAVVSYESENRLKRAFNCPNFMASAWSE
jgi:hypothetical protein